MALKLANHSLNPSIATDVARCIDILAAVCPVLRGSSSWWQTYKDRFTTRYEGRLVPLLEVLNPDTGLGLPRPDSEEINDRQDWQRGQFGSKKATMLGNLINNAIRDCVLEIELNGELLAKLEQKQENANFPPSTDVFITLLAETMEDIDVGNYQLAINAITAGAARSIGRFCDLLGEPGQQAIRQVAEREQNLIGDRIHAELTSLPRKLRLGNVCTVPNVRPFQVVLDSWSDSTSTQIALNDLVIGMRNNHFFVRSISHQSDLHLNAQHLANPAFNCAISYFLRLVSEDERTFIGIFDWGPHWHSSFLPRLRYDKFILSRAQWSIELTASDRKQLQSVDKFREWLLAWRKRWFVPRYIYLNESRDHNLLIDLDDPLQSTELARELLEKKEKLQIREALFNPHKHWLSGARRKLCQ